MNETEGESLTTQVYARVQYLVEAMKKYQEREVTVAHALRDLGAHGTVLHRWVQDILPIRSRPVRPRGR